MEADPDKTFKIKNQNSMSSLRHCCRSGGINIRRSGMHASTNKLYRLKILNVVVNFSLFR